MIKRKLKTQPPCKTCGAPLTRMNVRGPKREFCSTNCRMEFHRRRQQRGADLYDLYMALRYERSRAQQMDLMTKLSRMAEQFRDEDIRQRDGRKSWRDPADVLKDRPDLAAKTLVKVL